MKEITLDQAKLNQEVEIIEILVPKNIKRRLLDIGMIPQTIVKPVLKNPAKNLIAINIRGAIIAIRSEDCQKIIVKSE